MCFLNGKFLSVREKFLSVSPKKDKIFLIYRLAFSGQTVDYRRCLY
ncbi:type II toxin-antitoxin system VapC family toxin [Treponema medium]|uniref:Type II toxin-antitoxin system VapC family toxin n=1 Tax=Treponema medium TaxID=58231 RepID=A0ABX7LZQ5_TREMD|nr:type II toxin-antitoxin system VapC family toxin [Treponema medium]QSH98448.1 type II toxin-antitoxin system VapC family toxin [Treponema medium]